MDRKRVLIISHTYTAPVNRLKFDIMAEDQRFEFLLVTPKRWQKAITVANNSSEVKAKRYRTIYVDVLFGWHPVLYVIPRLIKIINEFKPNLIYCEQEPICLVSLQTALLSKDIPIIYFSWENVDRKDMRYRPFWPVRTFCLRRSIFMSAGSRGAALVLRKHGYTKPIYITPILGVSEKLFYPVNSCSSWGDISLKIGYIGRFVRVKDVHTLLKAVRLLERSIEWHLFLLGGGPLRDEYEAFILNSGIKERVTFHSPVPHDKVPEFFKKIDVLVLPSKTTSTQKEQLGHVLIEAMACKVPVIGSSSGEIPKVIENAGLVFQEGDAEDLKSKLTKLAHDHPLRENLKERGLNRIKELYTDRRIAANMVALYEIALGMERITPNTLGVG